MSHIDHNNLDLFFADICIPYLVKSKYPASGQRDVYCALNTKKRNDWVVKIAHYTPYTIGRLKRELAILDKISSDYFPKIIWEATVTEDILTNYYDQLDFQAKIYDDQKLSKELADLKDNRFSPFLITIEEHVPNIPWADFTLSLTEQTLCTFIIDCLQALQLLWDNKIVHRDLKPENILIRPDFKPVIIDLGIAKSLNEGTQDLTLSFFKTPHTKRYASPEQLTDRKDVINYKTDQYSLGIIAYYALTNKFPFGDIATIGPSELIQNMFKNQYIPMNAIGIKCNPSLENVIKKLLMPEPYQRYRNADIIIDSLTAIEWS